MLLSTNTACDANSDINNINDNNDGASELIVLPKYNEEERNTVFITPTYGECRHIHLLLIRLSILIKKRQDEDYEQNIVSILLVDGECILRILLSKLSRRTNSSDCNKNNINNYDKSWIVKILDHVVRKERNNDSKYKENGINTKSINANKLLLPLSRVDRKRKKEQHRSILISNSINSDNAILLEIIINSNETGNVYNYLDRTIHSISIIDTRQRQHDDCIDYIIETIEWYRLRQRE